MKKTEASNTVNTSTKLCSAMLEDFYNLRSGNLSPIRANAISKMSDNITKITKLELDYMKYFSANEKGYKSSDSSSRAIPLG